MIATQQTIETEYAQKIELARAEVQERRDSAFIDTPFFIAGIEVRAMRLPDFLALIASGNAHVSGLYPGEDQDADAFWAAHNAQLIWIVSNRFSRKPEEREAFFKEIAALPYEQVCDDLLEYLRDTFFDSPRPAKTTDEAKQNTTKQNNPLRVSFAAVWISRLASRLHWSRTEILATPLAQIFQLLRVLDAEDSIAKGRNPARLTDEIDHLWAEMLARINALNTPEIK